MVSDERALAVRLATTDDDVLARMFAEPGVTASASWHDFFDASAALLDPASVDRAVARLPRSVLVSLAAADGGLSEADRDVLRMLALANEEGTPFGAVTARIRALSEARPEAFVAEADADGVVASAPADAAAAAAERAFTTVG